jgi:hypothetical protein
MNEDLDRTDRRLRALHTAMGENLDAILDLDGGLREVLIAAQHHGMGRTLDTILDVDAGLQAIVPTTEQLTATPATDGAPTSETIEVNGAVATLLMSLDTPTRLAIRNHPALEALAIVFALTQARLTARALVHTRALALALALDLNRDIDALGHDRDLELDLNHDARALAHALDHALDLDRSLARARALDHALDRARGLALKLAGDRARARVLARDRDLALKLARDRDIDRALDRSLDLARDRYFDLDRYFARARDLDLDLDFALDLAFDRSLGLARARDRDLARAHADAHCLARGRARALDHARHDFTTADLRGIDLPHVQLDGLRWSTRTQWPSETWRDQALQNSTEIKPGIYEIRGGTANVPMHTLI